MYKIAVMGDYDSIYGFATLGLFVCPVRTREEAREKLHELAEGEYGIIYITEAAAERFRRSYRYRACPGIPAPVWKA